MKKFFLPLGFSILALFSFQAKGQESIAEAVDQLMVEEYKTMMDVDPSVRYNVHAPKFKSNLLDVIKLEESIYYPFDSLSSFLAIRKSDDEKLRIFSWDEQTGGSSHEMVSLAQFVDDDGKVFVRDLNVAESDTVIEFYDVVAYKIHEIKIRDTTNYLVFGWGTHGGGHHFKTANLYRIAGGELRRCDRCFNDRQALEVVAPRTNEIELTFDPEAKTITYPEFQYDGEMGFYKATGSLITLKLVDGRFVP